MKNRTSSISSHPVSGFILVIGMALLLGSCATTHTAQPFATTNRIGKYPVQKNKPVRNNETWICRQWNHQGR